MACPHKFADYLALQQLDFEPEILIVGTFNPEWPAANYASWFYGRTNNNYFWDLLPRVFGDEGLRDQDHLAWKQYCSHRKIALTDLISSIHDAQIDNPVHHDILGKYTDTAIATKFRHQIANPFVPLLEQNPSIRAVYLTTTNKSRFWTRQWQPIEQYCLAHNLYCSKLMTPSKGARFQMKKGMGISMPDFIFNDWVTKWLPNA